MPPPASTAFARWTNISSEPRIGAVRTWAALACLAVPCVILALHAALLPQGRWYDEYFTFGAYRLYGWPGFIHRLASWSPRPVSEALIWGYWRAVHATGRPLVAPALLVAWGLAAQLLALAAKPWRRPGRGARLALVLALPAASSATRSASAPAAM